MNQKEFVHEISRLIKENPDCELHFTCSTYGDNYYDFLSREITKVELDFWFQSDDEVYIGENAIKVWELNCYTKADYKMAIIVYLE